MKRKEESILELRHSVIIIIFIAFWWLPNLISAQNCSVNAGVDTTYCYHRKIFLNGEYTGTLKNGTSWKQIGGTQVVIADSTDLKTEITGFFPGNSYIFRLSAECSDDTLIYEDVNITVFPGTIASAGPDTSYCAGVYSLSANAPLLINEVGEWSGSTTGITVDDINDPNSYITLSQTTAGFITLTWTITDTITGCSSSDNVIIINRGWGTPVSAGPNQWICLNDSVILSGSSAINYDSLIWTTDGTGVFNNPSLLHPVYYPSSGDSLNGVVNLTLKAFGLTTCGDSVSAMVLTITGDPVVFAGSDSIICSSQKGFGLSGNASDYSSVLWKTKGSGSFSDTNIVNAMYFPSATDIANGHAELILTAYGNGSCAQASDTMLLSIWKSPTVYAGKDAAICSGDAYQILDAETHNFDAFVWSHDGAGVLLNPELMSPTYISAEDETGIVNVILTGVRPDTSVCVSAIDTLQILISGTPDIFCPVQDTFTFDNTPGLCGYIVSDKSLDATGNLDCGVVDVIHNFEGWGNPYSLKGATFPVGTTHITWTATAPSGTSVSCIITVIVNDTEAPEFINCQSGETFTLSLFPGSCESIATWNIPLATDNCPGVNVIQSYGPRLGSKIGVGNYLIEYLATDTSGNYKYCNFSIEVINSEKPVIVCLPDLTHESDLGKCTWTSAPNSLSPLLVKSNCDIDVEWEVINPDSTVVSGVDDVSGYTFQPGSSWVKYILYEKNTSNQMGECGFMVTINGKPAPEIVCQMDTVFDALPGECSAVVELVPPTLIDSCFTDTFKTEYRVFNPDNSVSGIIPETNLSYEFMSGTSRIEWRVYDVNNNYSICFQNIRIDVDKESLAPDAGPNSVICEKDTFFITEAKAPGFETVKWTTSGTGKFVDPTQVNTAYIPSQLDVANGYTILTITNYTGCTETSDQMVLSISRLLAVSAGTDATICESGSYQLSGSISGTSAGIQWETTGSGVFSNSNALNPVYYPDSTDIASGSVQLILMVVGAGSCSNAIDTMNLFIEHQMTVDAGEDAWVCEGNTHVLSGATVSNLANVLWTTSGTGIFDDPTVVNASYMPSASDVINGKVILTITGNWPGSCSNSSDNLILEISKKPTGEAGENISICANQQVTISGAKAANYSSVFWTHNGNGELQYSNTLAPVYIPVVNEKGTVTLQMHIIGENACVEDTVIRSLQLQLDKELVIDAGDDLTIFANTTAKLSVSVEIGSGMYFFSWQPSMYVNDPNANFTETRTLSENTLFKITVTDAKTGCVATDSIAVKVEENPDALINIYNAISPNGDGVNDNWIIDGIEKFPENEVLIFNRWGDKLREIKNYNNESIVWNGTGRRDEKLPDGTYFYIVNLNEIKSYSGWVHIRSN